MFDKTMIVSELSSSALNFVECINDLKKMITPTCLLLNFTREQETNATVASFVAKVYEDNLNQQKNILKNMGWEVETRVVHGALKGELKSLAEKEQCSLIIVEASQYSYLSEALYGGVAYEVIQCAEIPVLMIKTRKKDGENSKQREECTLLDHILFPTDFSDNATRAYEYVKELVVRGVKKVTLAHVQDQSRIYPHLSHRLEEFNETDFQRLKLLKDKLQEVGQVDVEIHVSYGSPFKELKELVKDRGISLVVMGSQGRGFVKDLYVGSVTYNMARHSSVSVMLIPAKR